MDDRAPSQRQLSSSIRTDGGTNPFFVGQLVIQGPVVFVPDSLFVDVRSPGSHMSEDRRQGKEREPGDGDGGSSHLERSES